MFCDQADARLLRRARWNLLSRPCGSCGAQNAYGEPDSEEVLTVPCRPSHPSGKGRAWAPRQESADLRDRLSAFVAGKQAGGSAAWCIAAVERFQVSPYPMNPHFWCGLCGTQLHPPGGAATLQQEGQWVETSIPTMVELPH